MKLEVAKRGVLNLINRDITRFNLKVSLNPKPPGKDLGKFSLHGKTARIIAPFDGFFVNINLKWFKGSQAPPLIHREEFFWYVFALKGLNETDVSDYFICDYLSIRNWVLEFTGGHQNHQDWRGTIEIEGTNRGYFRWGGESLGERRQTRYINLNNIKDIISSISMDAPSSPYVPTRKDFIAAYQMVSSLGQSVQIHKVIDQIERNLKQKGYILKDNWRYITERNIEEHWS